MEISLGTNILEGGSAKRLSRELLKIFADGGVHLADLHVGVACDTDTLPCRVTNRFINYADRTQVANLKSWLRKLDLKPVCMHSACCFPLDPSHSHENLRQASVGEIKLCLEAAGELGIPVMVMHAGDQVEDGTTAEAKLAQLKRSAEELLPLARSHRVRLALENVYYSGSLFCRLKDLIGFVDEVDDEFFGICLDTGHFNLVDGRNVSAGVLAAGHKLCALHLHDNDGSSDQHLAPACGSIIWDGFTAALQKVGYRGTLNLEIRHPEDEQSLTPDLIRKLMNCARNLFGR